MADAPKTDALKAPPQAKGAGAGPAVATLSFEMALAELEGIVQRLERGDVPLEESIAIYERGELLKARCDALLKEAEARVETITRDADGRPSGTAPLDAG
ncbi:exodeoxyribonuclease VII small subunit [Roseixanthobacter liquoris]|uniref:exodeoxyribonuclease VII small subunit n=1 Tax=Roseixanthobacter liquoris TaxID=3119921 RepID=UPI003729B8A7